MTTINISKPDRDALAGFFKQSPQADQATAYLFYLGLSPDVDPVLFRRARTIFQNQAAFDEHIRKLEEEGKIWREASLTIRGAPEDVNEETTKVFICPFTGKAFGNNTHPSPQDAIYEWVSKHSTERKNGLPVKRFFISEDPEVIKGFIKEPEKEIVKKMYVSVSSGKLFNSKEAARKDFLNKQDKKLTLLETISQKANAIDEAFLQFIDERVQRELEAFIQAIAQLENFSEVAASWAAEEEAYEDEEASEE